MLKDRGEAFERFSRAVDGPMMVLALAMIPLIVVPVVVDLSPGLDRAFLAQPAPPDPQAAALAARGATPTGHRRRTSRQEFVAGGAASGAGLADPLERAATLLAVVVASAATPAAATAA